MQTDNQTKTFLARVMAWPQDGEGIAYCNIHNTFVPSDVTTLRKDKDGNLIYPWMGYPFTDAGKAAYAVARSIAGNKVRDIYFCTSTQSYAQPAVSSKGKQYLKAVRSQEGAVKMKALFIDIDLTDGKKDKSKGYDTMPELVTSLGNFLKATGMPMPTLVVNSGGGLHIYWILMKALTVTEWLPLAYALAEATKRHGLKCDTQCTIDAARVLRVPGTVNHKYDPPRPVKIVGKIVDYDYTNSKIEAILDPYRVQVPYNVQNASMTLFPPKASIQGSSDLSSGIDMSSSAPIDLDSLVSKCGFVAEALATGGANFTNPLWNLTTLMATFTAGGRADAHRMANGHPNYGPGETDELYDRKEQEKVARNLGWPRCAAISASGCTSCATCPLLPDNKSPFNHAAKVTPQGNTATLVGGFSTQTTAAVAATGTTIAPLMVVPGTGQQDPDLPDGFLRNQQGLILQPIQLEDGTTEWHPLSTYPMVKPWLQRDPWRINFTTETEFGKTSNVCVPTEVVGTGDLRKKLQEQGFMISGSARIMATISEFIMSWIKKLQSTKDAVIATAPFGWAVQNGNTKGFVFAGKMFTPTGEEAASSSDPELARQYQPTGDVQPWLDAAKMITDQKRPGLDAIIASAFAGPLVRFTGHSGLLMSAFSMESGIGKSTALKIAQAVWGDPVKAVQSLSDTQNSVLNKMGELRSLPMYWDELKSEEDTKRFIDTVFRLTLGKEKSRMTSKVVQKTPGTWQTIMVSASNDSLLDSIAFKSRTSTAGIYRVFEYTLKPAQPNSPGQIDPTVAQRVIAKLHDNYGAIGMDYAAYLGGNHAQVEQDIAAMTSLVGQEVNMTADERFWVAIIAVILQGAIYANQFGASIDVSRLKAFMYLVFREMRTARGSVSSDMRNHSNVVSVVARFLNENRARNTISTNVLHRGRGKAAAGAVEMRCDGSRLETIHVHIAEDDKILRFGREYFFTWLTKNDYPRHVMGMAIIKELNAQIVNARLGAGTGYVGAAEFLFEIDLRNSPLMNFIDEA